MKHRKLLALALVMLLLLGLLSGCGAQMKAEDAYYAPAETAPMTTGAAADYESALTNGSKAPETAAPVNQKLIRRVYLDAETEDMDALLEAVYSRVAELEGYIENRNINNGSSYYGGSSRYGELTIRIPADRLDQFVEHVGDVSNITSNRESTEDVTLSYVATESRIIALETEQTRLLELLAKAQDMKDLLMIESRLTEVREELERVKSQLRVYDNLVSYSTVNLSIREVREYTVVEPEPETVWERIGKGFVKSAKGLWNAITEVFVFLVVALPYFAFMALLAGVIILLSRLGRKKKKSKMPVQTSFQPEKKEE